jgi:FMN-dependent NADH-azoreductase
MKILHLDSSILGDASASRVLSAALVDELRTRHPDAQPTSRDLASNPIGHLDGLIASGFRQPGNVATDAALRAEHALSETLVSELLESDVIVLGVPMYNFFGPQPAQGLAGPHCPTGTHLPAYRDRSGGPVRRQTRRGGLFTRGMYSSGPANVMDHQESYLKAFFGFIGIQRVHFVRAELLTKGAELRSTRCARHWLRCRRWSAICFPSREPDHDLLRDIDLSACCGGSQPAP